MSSLNIREVAKQCNVSPATVSRVLNCKANPNHETTLRVQEVLKKTAYKRTRNVSGVTASYLLLMAYPNTTEHATNLMSALQSEASEQNVRVIVQCGFADYQEKTESMVRDFSCSGIITVGKYLEFEGALARLPRVALTQHQWLNQKVSCVENDDLGGFVQAFEHLRSLGHQRIGFFVDDEISCSGLQVQRQMFPSLYSHVGLEFDKELLWNEHFEPEEHDMIINKAVNKWWGLDKPPTAIVLTGDCYASAFYRELAARGLSVPKDVSITGYANNALGRLISPNITTSSKNFQILAASAIDLLKKRIANPSGEKQTVIVSPKLVVRDSTAAVNNRSK